MNWDAIGAIGELISALAVLITLVYLSLQVRGLSADMYSAHLSRIDEGERDLRRLKLDHSKVLLKGASSPEHLSDLERFQLRELYRSHEAFFFFSYLRAKGSGGNEDLHAKIFAETLVEYPAFAPLFEQRDFGVLGNPDRIRFGEIVKNELKLDGA